MGYRHSAQGVLDAAVALAHEQGLGRLTFGSVGRRCGIPDRTVVYYFPTKDALVAAVLQRATAELLALLADEVGDRIRPDRELLAASWAALRREQAAAGLRLYVETAGLSAQGTEPYRSVVRELVAHWTGWCAARLEPDGESDAGDRAAALVATLDGLLLLAVTVGPEAADAAARGLGLGAQPASRARSRPSSTSSSP